MTEKTNKIVLNLNLPILSLGYRPFFFLAGLSALLLIPLWAYIFVGGFWGLPLAFYFSPMQWHAHEMLFGYAITLFAGFLLTAVRNWTGVDTARFGSLLGLVLLWMAGRVVLWFGGVFPDWLIFALDLGFPLVFALHISWVIVRGGRPRNYQFWLWLSILLVGNMLMHLSRRQGPNYFQAGWYLSFYTMLGILSVVAGRILPFFTERGVSKSEAFHRRPWLDHLALGSLFLAGLSHYFYASGALGRIEMRNVFLFFPGLAALVHGLRLSLAFDRRIFRVPLLWILHAGYAWLVLGFLFLQIILIEGKPALHAIHALSTGAFGAFALGMMARVSLGHSGRPLQVHPLMNLSFVSILLVPLFRAFVDFWFPKSHLLWIGLSAGLWSLAFLIFLVIYTPIFFRPRADAP